MTDIGIQIEEDIHRAANRGQNKSIAMEHYHSLNGAPETNRTSDLPLRRGSLYPLSYRGTEPMIPSLGEEGEAA